MTAQLTLDAVPVDVDLCDYGQPKLGEPRRCDRTATHAAVSHTAAHDLPDIAGLGVRHQAEHTARIQACRTHADYYATAWAHTHVELYPHSTRAQHEATWIEALA